MKGIISNVLEWCKKNNKSLLDAQKYLKKQKPNFLSFHLHLIGFIQQLKIEK